MKVSVVWVLMPLCLLSARPGDPTCSHPTLGESHPVSLDRVANAQADLRRKLSVGWEKSLRLTPDLPYDSGLPGCRAHQTRRRSLRLPPELVGRTFAFAPSERMPAADVRVATSSRRLIDAQVDALADPRLIERLGVRCAPTLIRAISEVELELVENP